MTKVDFYILPYADKKAGLQFACRLIEKAYQQQHRIYIHVDTEKEAHDLDELLWTYRIDNFLPHNLYGEGPDLAPPIQIGFNIAPEKQRDILFNLSQTVPLFYPQFTRILELVPTDTAAQERAREHYRFYRDAKCEMITHKLPTVEA